MGNGKRAKGVPGSDGPTPGMPGFTAISVVTDVEQGDFPLDPQRIVAAGDLTAIGLMRNATQGGKAGVLIAVTLPDGGQVAAQTTWALLRTAVNSLAASPTVAEEVIEP